MNTRKTKDRFWYEGLEVLCPVEVRSGTGIWNVYWARQKESIYTVSYEQGRAEWINERLWSPGSPSLLSHRSANQFTGKCQQKWNQAIRGIHRSRFLGAHGEMTKARFQKRHLGLLVGKRG